MNPFFLDRLLKNAVCWFDSTTARAAASASVVGMTDRIPIALFREAAQWAALGLWGWVHAGFLSGRLTSSNVATWVLSNQDSNVAPQTLQDA
jgi:hypothetical protein